MLCFNPDENFTKHHWWRWQDDDGPAIPKFGGWDEKDPASAEAYTHIFNKAREDRHNGGGKSPMVSTDNVDFYGQNQRSENSKVCYVDCFC